MNNLNFSPNDPFKDFQKSDEPCRGTVVRPSEREERTVDELLDCLEPVDDR